MTTRTATLAEFLTARLDEDERLAKVVQSAVFDGFVQLWLTMEEWPERTTVFTSTRALAEVDAKRWIVAHAERAHELGKIGPSAGDGAWFLTLRYLALPYADHPDYNEAWRP